MIALRTFVIGVCASLVLMLVAIHYAQSNLVLGQRFSEIEQTHRQAVIEYASTILRAKQYLLSTYALEVNNGGHFSRLVLDRHNSASAAQLTKDIKGFNKKTGLDSFQVYPIKASVALGVDGKLFSAAVAGRQVFGTTEAGGATVLVSYFPLKLFENTVGVGSIAIALNGSISDEVKAATGASVHFLPIEKNASGAISINDEAGKPFAAIKISQSTLRGITHRANASFLTIGLLGLFAALAFVYSVLYFGFARSFEKITSELDQLAHQVDQGEVSPILVRRFSVKELSNLSLKLSGLAENILLFKERIARKSRTEATGEQAEQLSHDLKGPVAALAMAVESGALELSAEGSGKVLKLIDRIRAVATDLERKQSGGKLPAATGDIAEDVGVLAETIVIEKSFQYQEQRNLAIRVVEPTSKAPMYARVDRAVFLRVLSNLIDNAVEAISGSGNIDLSLRQKDGQVIVVIQDRGPGIPSDHLKRLGERGFTVGKKHGSGLGVWYALKSVESWGGTLKFISEKATGTQAVINLPIAAAPHWGITAIEIPEEATIVICDDDQWVHDAWLTRIKTNLGDAALERVRHCYSSDELVNAVAPIKVRKSPFVLLCDYDLGAAWTGLELVEQLGLTPQAILVTSHEHNSAIRTKCQEAGIKLLAKDAIRNVPMVAEFRSPKKRKRGTPS